jgi:hypothetical protein
VVGGITATVTIAPIQAVAKELSAPVEILADKELLRSVDIGIAPPRVLLTVRGPANLVGRLTPTDVTAYVRLPADVTPGQGIELPVQVVAPSGMTIETGTVTVTVGASAPK